MTLVTLRVLDGADRGRTYADLPTPFTIGREDGNAIQLNDERISRFHVKIQEDEEKLVLTDLESTNGTRVNGEDIQLSILRFGDLIQVGRSLLLYGTREQIAGRLAELQPDDGSETPTASAEQLAERIEEATLDADLSWNEDPVLAATIYASVPPELPERLSPGQAAQLSELLEYIRYRLRDLIDTVGTQRDRVTLDAAQWQNLIDVQARLAEYVRHVADPDVRDD